MSGAVMLADGSRRARRSAPAQAPVRSSGRLLGRHVARAVARLFLLLVSTATAYGSGMRGYLAVHGDRVLASENAEQLFTPASVQKIVVSAAALHSLGPHHQIETAIRARGSVRDGVLHGDLVVVAAGDPTWSRIFFPVDPEAPFRALADQVRRAGIVQVEGDLVVDVSRFPGRRAPTSRSQAEMGLGFGAPVSALAVDENTVDIRIAPAARVGRRASVTTSAAVELRNDTVTVAATRHGRGSVEFLPQWGDGAIRVRGEYPLSEAPYTVRVSLPSPELATGKRLLDHLGQAGVIVRGRVAVETLGVDGARRSSAIPIAGGDFASGDFASGDLVARIYSPALSEIVAPVLRDSSNWTAEMLVVLVALARTGEGRYDDGVEALGAFLVEDVGVAEGGFALDDASGLSPENLLSPQTVVAVLRFAWRAPWRDAFLAALATSGKGTLAAWPALPPVAAKTGTLKHTLALAGVLAAEGASAPGSWIAVAPAVVERGAAPGSPDTSRSLVQLSSPSTSTDQASLLDSMAPSTPPDEPIVFAVFINHDLRDRASQRREIANLLRSWRRLAAGSS